ncbi:MAG: hypothetical protein AB2795_21085 [Candidatus Thiodiazotropha endolucinida]
MLRDSEWDILRGHVLEFWINTTHPIENLIAGYGDADFIANIHLGTKAAERAANFIFYIKQATNEGNFDPLDALITQLMKVPQISVRDDLLKTLTSLQRRAIGLRETVVRHDPYNTPLLRGSQVFLDRGDLRQALRKLRTDADALVLRVVGKSPGKSYTKELILHLARSEGFRRAYVDLKFFCDPKDALEQLAMAIRSDFELEPVAGGEIDKWIQKNTLRLISLANESEHTWWFVLDQCNHVTHDLNLMNLINRLSEQVKNNTLTQRAHRVLLLGHEEDLTDEMFGLVVDNETRPLSQSDVRQTLQAVAQNAAELQDTASNLSNAEMERRIDVLVAEVWNQANNGADMNPTLLNKALSSTVARHFMPT